VEGTAALVTAVKRSIALLIRQADDADAVLLVRRPPDDADLPDAWGLPAATRGANETAEAAGLRTGCDKLGVKLEIGAVLNEGSITRDGYVLDMQLLEARIASGSPRAVADATDGTTRYAAWRWGPLEALELAAARGSLCCRLALETRDR
jgi:hypothetical protein